MDITPEIGRYKVVRELGRGGMAVVYLAEDPYMQRQVAIKLLPPQFIFDPQFRGRFQREARIIAALEHPAIVPVYDFGEHNQQPFLVMRHMTGGTLKDRLTGRMPLPEIVRILSRLGPALDKAHEQGIIHRDLKPDNVLFDSEDRPYLADFGIARLAEATHTMTIAGTPSYMSPEQVQGDQELDGRSDIYALGIILYEMMSGRPPYEASTPTKLMMKHVLEPVPNILDVHPELPAVSQLIIEKVLAKDRNRRYRSCMAIVADVERLVHRPANGGNGWQFALQEPPGTPTAPIRDFQGAIDETQLSPMVTPVPPAKAPVEKEIAAPAEPARPARRKALSRVLIAVMAVVVVSLLGWAGYQAAAGNSRDDQPAPLTGDLVTRQTIRVTATPNAVLAAATAGSSQAAVIAGETPSPAATDTPLPTATETAAPTETATAAPSSTPRSSPTATATEEPTATPTQTPAPTPVNPVGGSSSGGGLPLGFESFGIWIRGDEQNGELSQSSAQQHGGSYSARLSYDFRTTDNDYVVFMQSNSISGSPNALRLWVYGDGSGHFVNGWILDASGQTWQVPFGQLFHTGWAQLTGYINTSQEWPWTHISGPNNQVVDYPISFRGLVVDDYSNSFVGQGVVYFDDLTAATLSADAVPTAASATAAATTSAAQPTVVPYAGEIGRIIYTSGSTILTTDPSWTSPIEIGTSASNSCSSPASTITGQNFNLSYGNFCSFGGVCTSPNGQVEIVSQLDQENSSIVTRLPGSDQFIFVYQGRLDEAEGLRWNPDSSSFMFVVGDTVHLGYPGGGYDEIITLAYTPMFSPDGSMILFRKPVGPGVNDIFVSDRSGLNQRNVTNVINIDKRCAAWKN